MVITLENEITKSLDFYAPLKSVDCANEIANDPWITQGLLLSLRNCNRKCNVSISCGKNSQEYLDYKQYGNLLNRTKCKAKTKYYSDLFKKIQIRFEEHMESHK